MDLPPLRTRRMSTRMMRKPGRSVNSLVMQQGAVERYTRIEKGGQFLGEEKNIAPAPGMRAAATSARTPSSAPVPT